MQKVKKIKFPHSNTTVWLHGQAFDAFRGVLAFAALHDGWVYYFGADHQQIASGQLADGFGTTSRGYTGYRALPDDADPEVVPVVWGRE